MDDGLGGGWGWTRVKACSKENGESGEILI